MLTIKKSACGNFIRVSIGNVEIDVPLGDWAFMLSQPEQFSRFADR